MDKLISEPVEPWTMAGPADRADRVPFVLLAFGISWPLFLLPLAFGSPGEPAHAMAALVTFSLAMWGPGLAAILLTKRRHGAVLEPLGLKRLGPKRWYLWAWLLWPVLAVATGLVTWGLGWGTFDPSLSAIRDAMAGAPGDFLPMWAIVGIQVLLSITVAPLINTVLAMGEELGWRGFLLGAMLPRGQARAIVGSGVIWGLWHAPAILQGHNYPEHRFSGVVLMVLASVLLGTVLSWLYLVSQSPWVPALAHGSINAVAGLPLLVLVDVDLAFGGTLVSLAGCMVVAGVVAWLGWSGRLPVRDTGRVGPVEPVPGDAQG